jgi:hypothetical protein
MKANPVEQVFETVSRIYRARVAGAPAQAPA